MCVCGCESGGVDGVEEGESCIWESSSVGVLVGG